MRGLVEGWPAVNSATRSAEDLQQYLTRFDNGGEVDAFVGDPAIAGKYYYARDLKGFNFERRRMRLAEALAAIVATRDRPGSPTMYVGSVPINDFLARVYSPERIASPAGTRRAADLAGPSLQRIGPFRCVRQRGLRRGRSPPFHSCIRRRPSQICMWGPSTIRWRDNPSAWPLRHPRMMKDIPIFAGSRAGAERRAASGGCHLHSEAVVAPN
jgi:hypothetical protein